MRVVVLSNRVPFVYGGAEELYHHLIRNLSASGVDVDGFRLPFTWDPPERLLDEMLIARRIRLSNVDRVIALKFPAYLVPWHSKTIWLLHQFRQAYDLLDAGQSNISADSRGRELLSAIRTADNDAFADAHRLFVIAPTVASRLHQYNGIVSTVLRQPLNDPEWFTGGESDGYILATGRINHAKRQHLLVHGLKYARNVHLVIAGPPDSDPDRFALEKLVAQEGVEDRVTLRLRFLPRSDLAQLVNRALAVTYLPFQEDSLGYCTMEALQASKPIITTNDSGGVLDIINHCGTGLVAAPTPESLGAAMEALASDPAMAVRLGRAGRAALDDLQLNWPMTIEKLLS